MMARVQQVAGPGLEEIGPPEIVVERYPAGGARSVTQTRRDAGGRREPDGLLTEWWPSGTLRRVVDYADGVPRAAEVTWDESGRRNGRGGVQTAHGSRLEGSAGRRAARLQRLFFYQTPGGRGDGWTSTSGPVRPGGPPSWHLLQRVP